MTRPDPSTISSTAPSTTSRARRDGRRRSPARSRRPGVLALAAALAAVTAATTAAGLAPSAGAAAVPQVTVTPGSAPRGADTPVPVLDGDRVVASGTSIAVPGRPLWLVGEGGGGFVVLTQRAGAPHLVTVAAGADPVDLGRISEHADPGVGSDGSVVLTSTYGPRAGITVLRAIDPADGALLARRTVRGYAFLLDGDATHAVLGADHRSRTLAWTYGGGLATLSDQLGVRADLGADVLAVLTGDPYQGGCTRVVPLSDPARTTWRDCREAVVAIAPDGRLATTDILADGLGPSRIVVRTPRGRATTDYRSGRTGIIDVAGWEGDAVVLRATGPHRSALVRCTGSDCERATPRFGTGLGG